MSFLTNEPHEITKADCKYRLFYFLCDLGIKSAHEPAVISWIKHTEIITELCKGAWDDV